MLHSNWSIFKTTYDRQTGTVQHPYPTLKRERECPRFLRALIIRNSSHEATRTIKVPQHWSHLVPARISTQLLWTWIYRHFLVSTCQDGLNDTKIRSPYGRVIILLVKSMWCVIMSLLYYRDNDPTVWRSDFGVIQSVLTSRNQKWPLNSCSQKLGRDLSLYKTCWKEMVYC